MEASYLLGLIFIFLVSVIWSLASILVQYMYQGLNFNSPFLLTYIGTSLFVILIPSRLIWERWHYIQDALASTRPTRGCGGCGYFYSSSVSNNREGDNGEALAIVQRQNVIIPWATSQSIGSSQQSSLVEMKENFQMQYSSSSFEETVGLAVTTNDGDVVAHEVDEAMSQVADNDIDVETSTLTHRFPMTPDDNENLCDDTTNYIFSHQDHMKMAIQVAPIWFISNYFYNLSLAYTTITSSTVLSSTGSVFTFIFSLTCGDEKFTCCKMLGVSLAFFGSVITSFHDASKSQSNELDIYQHQLWGDAAGLISAVGYGGYTVLIRNLCPTDENRMSMQLFLGYIGLMNMVLLSPAFLWVLGDMGCKGEDDVFSANLVQDMETPDGCNAQRLTAFVLACLIIKGLLDNVLSDYLWARAIVLTSATVATVGLGLTIPLALLSDIFLMQRNDVFSFGSICGAIFVLIGFVFVNLESG